MTECLGRNRRGQELLDRTDQDRTRHNRIKAGYIGMIRNNKMGHTGQTEQNEIEQDTRYNWIGQERQVKIEWEIIRYRMEQNRIGLYRKNPHLNKVEDDKKDKYLTAILQTLHLKQSLWQTRPPASKRSAAQTDLSHLSHFSCFGATKG